MTAEYKVATMCLPIIFSHYDTMQGQSLIQHLNEAHCLCVVWGFTILIDFKNITHWLRLNINRVITIILGTYRLIIAKG